MEQSVIRKRLAKFSAEAETLTTWLEALSHQLHHMSKEQADARLRGLIVLAKAKAGKVLEKCAVLFRGSNGYTRTRQGELVESERCSGGDAP
jgi:acyl-CoA dehydrogenase